MRGYDLDIDLGMLRKGTQTAHHISWTPLGTYDYVQIGNTR